MKGFLLLLGVIGTSCGKLDVGQKRSHFYAWWWCDHHLLYSRGHQKGFSVQLPNKRGFLSSLSSFHLRAPITAQQWNSDKPPAAPAVVTILWGLLLACRSKTNKAYKCETFLMQSPIKLYFPLRSYYETRTICSFYCAKNFSSSFEM